ncbi:DUF2848 domain-containing protein [Trinickia soli]|uniref:DUF2848 domain-containing protein n=1 Tax=Trinickia soli TaxID=380675 RepID=A0A2N7VLI8_9BURK|nr:DUF2848 domain-containing protein [Trinickia soli]KAA0091803.1 DUF2848 domain-containing protein [Paraburkholderia sp. T12-10]PMS18013.1 DUF2848 domain-containing protein [Trinickia soli]CAB3722967.1 hypothetical protein LMG24076_04825 [Trinickia soli]
MLNLQCLPREGEPTRVALAPSKLAIAGWTGRDPATLQAHIEELAKLGVPPPLRTPLVYRVSASLLTQQDVIQVQGERTSGEAEFVLTRLGGHLWVGIGSDHTCRALETLSVPASKQCCAKPIGPALWRFSDLQAHWDRLQLRSYAVRKGHRMPYQCASVAAILPPDTLLGLCEAEQVNLDESLVFCGTVPLLSGWAQADEFICELHDPVLNRRIECRYGVQTLD